MPAASTQRSSGNLLADRRYAYAQGAFDDGNFVAAADLARQVLELAPDYAPAHALLGRSESALGRPAEAVAALERAAAIEPEDALGVRIDLARLGALADGEAISEGYVRALFDDYAASFDRHLVKSLRYRGPDLVAEALRRAASRLLRPYRFERVLDLGCGTGLMGRALEGAFRRIEGVDLSPRMLARAGKTRLYERLHEGDLVGFLRGRPDGSADLVVAVDVFVYMAALDEVFGEAGRVLGRGGFFAFTTQEHDGERFALGEDARYAHSKTYLRGLAARTGFRPLHLERVSTRQDRGRDVPGLLAVLERAETP
jgi:predicted TPR repeat methyltransferase